MIYIVEDDESIRELVLYALKNENYEATGVSNFEDFQGDLKEKKPTLVLLDIMLPGKNGLEILQWMREGDYPNTPVILLTAKDQEIDKVKGLDLGADDYVTKPFSVLELLARIRARLRGQEEMKELKTKDLEILLEKRKVYLEGEEVSLNYKEYELLKYLVENRNRVLTREQIMDAVWGYDYMGLTRTVDVHIAFIRQKLGPFGDRIKTIRNVGYMLEEE